MKQSLTVWSGRWRSLSFWFSVGLGSGLIRPAPGTWGSIFALVLGYFALEYAVSLQTFLIAIALVLLFGTLAINQIEKLSGIHDAPEIVIDEVAGMWVAMLPFFHLEMNWMTLAIAFGLFRFFDIVKPWPIGWLDKRISGGFGVIIDDIVAGLFAVVGIEIFFLLAM